MSYSLFFCGLFVGVLIDKYLFPIFDLLLDVFSYKKSEKATMYQLSAQELAAEFYRKYPEMKNDQCQGQYQELTPAIGFTYRNQNEDDIYFEDEECGKK